MTSREPKRGKQFEYSKLLDAFSAKQKGFAECVNHLVSRGLSLSQANNAVHVYCRGGAKQVFGYQVINERNY